MKAFGIYKTWGGPRKSPVLAPLVEAIMHSAARLAYAPVRDPGTSFHGVEEREAPSICRLRLLLVSDSLDRLSNLRASLGRKDVEIISTLYPGRPEAASGILDFGELKGDSRDYHLAIVDVGPAHLEALLEALRRNPGLSRTSVLVEASRIASERGLAGVLPQYRAMACSDLELVNLVRRRAERSDGRKARRFML